MDAFNPDNYSQRRDPMKQYQIEPSSWHFDRRIQISHILATLSFIVGGVFYAASLRADVDSLRTQLASLVVAQGDRDQRQDANAAQDLALLRDQLQRIEAKLDRLIEGRIRPAK